MTELVFIGGIGKIDEFGGELSKNKLIISRLCQAGARVIAVDTNGARKNIFKLLILPFKLMRNPNTPVIFSTSFGNIRTISSLVRRVFRNRPLVLWVIGGTLHKQLESGEYTLRDLSVFDRIFVESVGMKDSLRSQGVKNVYYVPNFKDMTYSDVCRKQHSRSELRCVFFSRIEPLKGVNLIFETFEKGLLNEDKYIIDFFGPIKEDYKEQFNKRISSHPNMNYRGVLNFFDGSAQKLLTDYDIALFPTLWPGEGFPGVIVDSYSVGLPVLASDWNHNSEFVIDKERFMFETGNVEEFAKKINWIYDNKSSLSDYSKKCKDESKRFDVKNVITEDFISQYIVLNKANY